MIEEKISILKYKPLSSSSYIKLSKESNHSRECLVNIQNTDDKKYLKWCLVKYLHPADKSLSRIKKTEEKKLQSCEKNILSILVSNLSFKKYF